MRKARASTATAALAAIFFITAASCGSGAGADFTGAWNAVGLEGAYFSLTLVQEGGKLNGWHEGGLADASRIDAAIGTDEPSVTGKVTGKRATLKLVSGYSPEVSFIATLTLRGDGKAEWKAVRRGTGEAYIPLEAVLEPSAELSSGAEPGLSAGDELGISGASVIRDGEALMASVDAGIDEKKIVPAERPLDGSTEGGAVYAWREGGQLIKLELVRYGETGKSSRTYWMGASGQRVARFTTAAYAEGAPGDVQSEETTMVYWADGEPGMVVAPDGSEPGPDSDAWKDAVAAAAQDLKAYGGTGRDKQ